jgi:hypothetical protein
MIARLRRAHPTWHYPLLGLCLWSASAAAQSASVGALPPEEAAPAPAPAPAPSVVAPLEESSWEADFQRAKADFISGRFEAANQQLPSLAARAATPIDQARAIELLGASREWTRRGATLIEQSELAGSDVLSRRTDRRTSDEIGVLYLSSIVYGLGTGVWLDVLVEPDTIEGAILPPLLLAGASVGAVALIDSGKGLRYGTAQSISTGMTLGFAQGFAWSTYYQATSSWYDQMEPETYASVLWATTTVGAVTGGVLGTVNSTTPGRAAFVGSTALWPALVLGLGAAGLSPDDNYRDDNALLASAIGATAGTLGGVFAAGAVSPSTARVRFLDLGAIGGGLAVGGLALAARAESTTDGSEIMLATDLGVLAGLGLAWWLTDDMPRDLGVEPPAPDKVTVMPTLVPQRNGLGFGAVGSF